MQALEVVIRDCKDRGVSLRTILKLVRDIYKNI